MIHKKESRTIFVIFCVTLFLSTVFFSGCPTIRDAPANADSNAVEDNVNQSLTVDDKTDIENVNDESTGESAVDEKPATEKASTEAKGNFTHMDAGYADVLRSWLKDNSSWEPALRKDAEATNPGSKKHPFYITGDFNKDGKEDFIVGLAKTKNRKKHAFIVFNAPFTSKTPAFFTDRTESYDIIGYDGEFGIFIGPAQSDNGYSLKPEGDKYVVDDSEMGEGF